GRAGRVRGGQDAVEVQDQGGLAGAVRAQQSDPLAAFDGQVDAPQRDVPVRVRVAQAAHLKRGSAHGVDGATLGAYRRHRRITATAATVTATAGTTDAAAQWAAVAVPRARNACGMRPS